MLLTLLVVLVVCAVLCILEVRGVRTTLELNFKGDVKRETRWLAQYGQSVCTPLAGILVWQIDVAHRKEAAVMVVTVFGVSIVAMLLKRLLGRVRPGREGAGKFLGPTLRHANWRESFPSSHSACAMCLSAFLAQLYPQAAITFWVLAILCSGLRYILDAHWPSDVLAGSALGLACAWSVMRALHMLPG